MSIFIKSVCFLTLRRNLRVSTLRMKVLCFLLRRQLRALALGASLLIGLSVFNLPVRALACEAEAGNALSARVLPKGALSASVSYEYRKYDELGHLNAHELHEEGRHVHNFDHDQVYSLALGYGVTNDFELGLRVPYVQKKFLRVEDGVVGKGDSSKGIGDVVLQGKYCFFHGFADLAGIAGVKFPTGDTAQRGFDDRKLAVEEQPGSGSFDYLLGLAASKEFSRWLIECGMIYTFRNQGARDYEFGDALELGVSAFYALIPDGRFPNYRIGAEIRQQFIAKDRDKGMKVADSASEVLFFSPGFQADINEHVAAFVSAPVPVAQNRGGEHSELDYSVIAGVKFIWS